MRLIGTLLMIVTLAACGSGDDKSPFNNTNANMQTLLTANYSLDCDWRSSSGGSGQVTFSHTSSRDVGLEGSWSGAFGEQVIDSTTGQSSQLQYQVQMNLRLAQSGASSTATSSWRGDASATFQVQRDGRYDGSYPMTGTFNANNSSVRIDLRSTADQFTTITFDCQPR